jgi:hypothetical protein
MKEWMASAHSWAAQPWRRGKRRNRNEMDLSCPLSLEMLLTALDVKSRIRHSSIRCFTVGILIGPSITQAADCET